MKWNYVVQNENKQKLEVTPMYRIALCDDQSAELNKTKSLLDDYKIKHPDCDFTVHAFTNISSLKTRVTSQENFDLLLLDIYMPEKNGIEGAKELRECGFEGELVFLTTSLEHGLDAFGVDATQYLVKPIDKNRFFSVLESIFTKIKEERRGFILMRTEWGLQRVAIRDIVYCEAQQHYIHINLIKGDVLCVRMTLTEFRHKINQWQYFVNAGKTYLINLGYVDSLTAKAMVLTTGKTIWLPRGSYATLKKQYFHFFRKF